MLGLHIKKCAEQADNGEVENREGKYFICPFQCFVFEAKCV